MPKQIKFIDLFAGIGGIRLGFEEACSEFNLQPCCVFTSEIKKSAIKVLHQNHPNETIHGDITKINSSDIPDFDFLLAGFPCQAFSAAGKRLGFEDTRGTLFFEVARILKEKSPTGFLLENVEGLKNHDKKNKYDEIGNTLNTILNTLRDLGYKVSWKILNSKYFGVAQERKRIYIVGTKKHAPVLNDFLRKEAKLESVLEYGSAKSNSEFSKILLDRYPLSCLKGKAIKDKRGGENNIHSWDLDLKGETSKEQKELLNSMLKQRRKKQWALENGIDWMDGMPLTINQIKSFYDHENLKEMLDDLVLKGYLKFEHPKKKVGNLRIADESLAKGYNIVTGKLSFEINKILDPQSICPTLVAMDMMHLYVIDGNILRKLTLREGLRLFGFPEDFIFDVSESEGYDLLGNTVVVPVIKEVSKKILYDKINVK